MSMLYAASGDMDEAFAWLKKAYKQGDASLVWSKVAPESDLLRSACRLQQFPGTNDFSARAEYLAQNQSTYPVESFRFAI
jgi:hypothetical protein